MAKRVDGLDIDQDLDFQRAEWRFQRLGWWFLTAFVLVAASGVFGKGPLSHARSGNPGSGLWIEYDRFTRVGAQTRIAVHGIASPGGIHLRLNREFLEAHRLGEITPQPAAVDVGPSDVDMRFESRSSAGPFTIIFDVEPLRAGRHAVSVTSGNGSRVSFKQFAYF